MPKLLVFAPCEKVIIDQQNNSTLVSILQEWQANLPSQDQEPGSPVVIGVYRWEIFTIWYRLDEDADREFVQTCEMKNPAGQVIFTASITFRFTTLMHRNIIGVGGLPAAPGHYELALYLSETGAEKERVLFGTFPLIVRPVPSS